MHTLPLTTPSLSRRKKMLNILSCRIISFNFDSVAKLIIKIELNKHIITYFAIIISIYIVPAIFNKQSIYYIPFDVKWERPIE